MPGAGVGRPLLPLESVDLIRIAEGYYLQPVGQVAAKPYKLLVKSLSRSVKVAVAEYAWCGRERLDLLRVRDGILVLHCRVLGAAGPGAGSDGRRAGVGVQGEGLPR